MERKPKRARILAIVVISSLVLSFFIGLIFWNWYILDIKEIPVQVEVTDQVLVGFNTGTDKLYFGTLGPETFGERKTSVVSAHDCMVVIKVTGPVEHWMTVSQNKALLKANIPQEIRFRLSVPPDTAPGNYTGTAVIEYHRVLW